MTVKEMEANIFSPKNITSAILSVFAENIPLERDILKMALCINSILRTAPDIEYRNMVQDIFMNAIMLDSKDKFMKYIIEKCRQYHSE